MFKQNDRIICVTPPSSLTRNKVYTVDSVYVSKYGKRVILKEYPDTFFYVDRFVLDTKKEKLDNYV
jgi:predicted protein tyrosine phosphatase